MTSKKNFRVRERLGFRNVLMLAQMGQVLNGGKLPDGWQPPDNSELIEGRFLSREDALRLRRHMSPELCRQLDHLVLPSIVDVPPRENARVLHPESSRAASEDSPIGPSETPAQLPPSRRRTTSLHTPAPSAAQASMDHGQHHGGPPGNDLSLTSTTPGNAASVNMSRHDQQTPIMLPSRRLEASLITPATTNAASMDHGLVPPTASSSLHATRDHTLSVDPGFQTPAPVLGPGFHFSAAVRQAIALDSGISPARKATLLGVSALPASAPGSIAPLPERVTPRQLLDNSLPEEAITRDQQELALDGLEEQGLADVFNMSISGDLGSSIDMSGSDSGSPTAGGGRRPPVATEERMAAGGDDNNGGGTDGSMSLDMSGDMSDSDADTPGGRQAFGHSCQNVAPATQGASRTGGGAEVSMLQELLRKKEKELTASL